MNSPTPMPIRAHPPPARACVCSARPYLSRARAFRPCVYGTACVHGHEDLGSKRSRGPSGSDPSTPARIRHTRTPMLRGRARRCLGGVPGLYPAGLRLRLFASSSSSPVSSASSSSSHQFPSPFPSPLHLSLPFPPSPWFLSYVSPSSPLPLASSSSARPRIHVHPRN